jgi:hypothetical protein
MKTSNPFKIILFVLLIVALIGFSLLSCTYKTCPGYSKNNKSSYGNRI